jgi:lipopolysaccharide transport system permease protein
MSLTAKSFDEKDFQTLIVPGSAKSYWRDLWQNREVMYIFMYRDIIIQYKQAVLGFLWAVLKPVLSVVAFTIVFSKIANLDSPHMPYPVLVLSGILPWYFLSTAFAEMSNSLVDNQSMVSKIYFPRLLLPLSKIGVSLVDFSISLVLLIGLMFFYGMTFSPTLLALPLFIGFAILVALSGGLGFSALNVRYRDVRIVIPFVLQLGLYLSPIGYATELVPEEWRLLYSMNPVVGVVDGFRWSISGGQSELYWPGLAMSASVALVLLVTGLWYFRKVERTFADVI